MPRTIDTSEINNKTHRLRLQERAAPYWREVSESLHIGYRRGKPDVAGTWIVRERQHDGRYKQRRIGQADDFGAAGTLSYDEAVAAAMKVARILPAPKLTVHNPIDEWADWKLSTLTIRRSRQHVSWSARKMTSLLPNVTLDRLTVKTVADARDSLLSVSDDERSARSARASADRMLASI